MIMKCKFCGKEFKKIHNRQMYCSEYCRKEADKEATRNRVHRWYHKNKYKLNEKRRFGLGSGTLGAHRYNDFNKEEQTIQKEMSRLKLRK